MGIFDGMRQRQKARQKRRGGKQRARQKRRQTKAEGRFDPEVVAARQARRGAMVDKFGTAAVNIGASLLGQDAALSAYTDQPMGGGDYSAVAYEEDSGMDPMMIGLGVVAIGAVLYLVMKK